MTHVKKDYKIYFSSIQLIAQALEKIFFEDQYTDKVLQQVFKANPKCGSKDRSFIAESTYDIVRWWRLLIALNNRRQPKNKQDIYTVIGIYLMQENYRLPNFNEFKYIPDEFPAIESFNESEQVSLPNWLYTLLQEELPNQYPDIIEVLNQTAPVFIRCNTLKIQPKELIEECQKEEIPLTKVKNSEVCFMMSKRKNIFSTNAFKNGLFEVQDLGSQKIAEFTEVVPGMRVIDACSGAGGKALYLAAMMQNKGKIIALDTEEWKLQELRKRATRSGVHCIEIKHIENSKTIKRLKESADLVLLDVPCSGLGVLRRNPDAKWKLSPNFLAELRKKQEEILQSYSAMVKPNGILVYATCSVLPSENELQVELFMKNNPDFTLLYQNALLPESNGHDGFFMAKLKRANK